MLKKNKRKILILGGDGMLGHKFLEGLKDEHEVKATVRRPQTSNVKQFGLEKTTDYMYDVDATNFISIEKSIQSFGPDFVINCIGLTKSLCDTQDASKAIYLNALFPHMLLKICQQHGAKLFQFSSDCVFSGDHGNYGEVSIPDARDLYGLSKTLGEINCTQCLTIRKSTIGLERNTSHGLIEWFLSATGNIKGYSNALYSGLTSIELVRVVNFIISQNESMSGIIHVSSKPISKFSLLSRLSSMLGRDDLTIEEDQSFVCDRSLNGNHFVASTGYLIPSWDDMLHELSEEIKRRQ